MFTVEEVGSRVNPITGKTQKIYRVTASEGFKLEAPGEPVRMVDWLEFFVLDWRKE